MDEVQSVRRRHLLKRLEEVDLSPEEGQALLERIEAREALSEADRRHLRQVLESTREVLSHLEQQPPSARPRAERPGKRKQQLAKASRRRNRR